EQAPQAPATGFWRGSSERPPEMGLDFLCMAKVAGFVVSLAVSSVTVMTDPWLTEQMYRDAVVTVHTAPTKMLIGDLGWTREQAYETRLRLRAFEEDWDAPGMEIYDEL
ncbi:MAG TPA: hypothetical protein VN494_06470, partial [Patescibacteria group bacterium]|nr:hypothetical protein [Patescibacteria group bacterium]